MNIPVVQGTAVSSDVPYADSSYVMDVAHSEPHNHEKQTKFQDIPWAILFIVHLIVMIIVISLNGSGGGNGGGSYGGIIWLVALTAVVAIALSCASLGFMMKFPGALVKVSLFVTVGMSLAMAVAGFLTGQIWVGICGLLMFAIGVCYARSVWSR
jgi:cation transport ATPase